MAIKDSGGIFTSYVLETEPLYNGSPLSRSNRVILSPRFTDDSTAHTSYFDSSDDYSPAGCYVDLELPHAGNRYSYGHIGGQVSSRNRAVNSLGHTENYTPGTEPFAAQGYAISIWLDLGVGTAPHPGLGNARTYFSILRNSNGSHQGGSFWEAPSNVASYNSPRVFANCEKIHVTANKYSDPNLYRDWVCVANMMPYNVPGNCSHIRVINWGSLGDSQSRLTIQGFKIMYHAFPTDHYNRIG